MREESETKRGISRRTFLAASGAEAVALSALVPPLVRGDAHAQAQIASVPFDRHAVFAAFGDTLIPSAPGDPGYASLEKYNITAEVMRGLAGINDADLQAFYQGCAASFSGRNFLQLSEAQRAEYLRQIIRGEGAADSAHRDLFRRIYQQTRRRVFTVFYGNFPETQIDLDSQGVPKSKAGDLHQIVNPNTKELVTGWDIAGFPGPLSWEEEESRRAKYRPYWD